VSEVPEMVVDGRSAWGGNICAWPVP